MTFPITPLPSVHSNFISIESAAKQLQAEIGILEQVFGTLAQQILQMLIKAILNALNVNNLANDLEGMLVQVESALTHIPVANIIGFVETLAQQVIDTVLNALGFSGSGHQVSDLVSALQNFPTANIQGLFGLSNIGTSIQGFANSVLGGVNQAEVAVTAELADIGNAFAGAMGFLGWAPTGASAPTNSVAGIASGVAKAIAARAINQPSYMGIDNTAAVVFPLNQISGSSPTTVSVTASSSAIGFIGTQDGGIKKSACWLGQNTANITGLYINLYQVDTTTGYLNLLHSSPNYIGFVSNSLTWNYYDFPDPWDIQSNPGDWYAVEIQVTGTGTYSVVGIPNHWQASVPHPTKFPSFIAATRGAGSPPSVISNPSYSPNVPWFALCGEAGVSEHPPAVTPYSGAGTRTYTIPQWVVSGDSFDLVALAGGGGGSGGIVNYTGNGGGGGGWATATLVYGVDIPLTTTTFTVSVGGGGGAAPGNTNNWGGTGGNTTITIPGWGTLTAHGGAGGPGAVSDPANAWGGGSPGTQTFNGTPYYGGGGQGNIGSGGNGPGGGGAGGDHLEWYGGPFNGGPGADGAVWVTAYQTTEGNLAGTIVRPDLIAASVSLRLPVVSTRIKPLSLSVTSSISAPLVRVRVSALQLQASASLPVPSVARIRVPAPTLTAATSLPIPVVKLRFIPLTLTDGATIPTPTVRMRLSAPTLTVAVSMPVPSMGGFTYTFSFTLGSRTFPYKFLRDTSQVPATLPIQLGV